MYVDEAEQGRCTIDPKGNRIIDDSKADIIIPTDMSDELPINSINRALIYGVVTISNGFVYIPIMTGDVYVLNLKNGEFVARFECPDISSDGGIYNRAGIQGGVTVIKKRVIFYCGGHILGLPGGEAAGNIIQSINFDPITTSYGAHITYNHDNHQEINNDINNKSFLISLRLLHA